MRCSCYIRITIVLASTVNVMPGAGFLLPGFVFHLFPSCFVQLLLITDHQNGKKNTFQWGVWVLGSDPNVHSCVISCWFKRSWGCWESTDGPWINQPCILAVMKIYSITGGIGRTTASRSREGTHPRCDTGTPVLAPASYLGLPVEGKYLQTVRSGGEVSTWERSPNDEGSPSLDIAPTHPKQLAVLLALTLLGPVWEQRPTILVPPAWAALWYIHHDLGSPDVNYYIGNIDVILISNMSQGKGSPS